MAAKEPNFTHRKLGQPDVPVFRRESPITPTEEEANDFDPAIKLAELEGQRVRERSKLVADIREQIKELLVDNEVTIGEWFKIVKNINNLTDQAVPAISIKELINRHGRN